jgi:Ca2+-binding RTX toxin-like protein
VLEGGDGRDTLQGDGHSDTMTGGLGDDSFHARDGWVDSVVGGRGRDSAHVDADDEVTRCEVVDRAESWTSGVVDGPSIGRILAAQPHMGVYWLRPGRIPFRGSGPRSPDAS